MHPSRLPLESTVCVDSSGRCNLIAARRAKQVYAGAAAVAGLAGGVGIAEGQLLLAVLGEATAVGFVDAALVMRRAQVLNVTYEALRDLGRLGRTAD